MYSLTEDETPGAKRLDILPLPPPLDLGTTNFVSGGCSSLSEGTLEQSLCLSLGRGLDGIVLDVNLFRGGDVTIRILSRATLSTE